MKYTDLWEDLTRKMGYWINMDHPYVTYDNRYIETLWWLLKQLYTKGFLYQGYTIQPYSPAAGTGLSSHELNLPGCYQDVKDTTCIALFKLIRNKKSEFLFNNIDTTDRPHDGLDNNSLDTSIEHSSGCGKRYKIYQGKELQSILR